MSLSEVNLRAAADGIDQTSGTEVQLALRQLKQRRSVRSQLEVLQQTELASFDLEQAAYQLASEAEAQGDLQRAARWYSAAAINDFSDASLRLARVLDAMAEKLLHEQGGTRSAREDVLVAEACHWYAEALAAGETDAEDYLDSLVERHLGRARRSTAPGGDAQSPSPPDGARQSPGSRRRGEASPGAQSPPTTACQEKTASQPDCDGRQLGLAAMPDKYAR
jgi:TPR repeat protein